MQSNKTIHIKKILGKSFCANVTIKQTNKQTKRTSIRETTIGYNP